jgi:hypothetical protein
MLKCVLFLKAVKKGNYRAIGTAFLVNYDGGSYFITARHVLDSAVKNYHTQEIHLSLNSIDEDSRYHRTQRDEWVDHPGTDGTHVDISVLPVPDLDQSEIDLAAWNISDSAPLGITIATEGQMREWHIGIGEDLFFPGLFSPHAGYQRNLPIVRVGNIAAMPDALVDVRNIPMRVYLVEARSVAGFSGSPVFLHMGNPNMLSARPDMYLLGVIIAHYQREVDALDSIDDGIAEEYVNMGIAMVVPIELVVEVLNMPRLADTRKEAQRKQQDSEGEAVLDAVEGGEERVSLAPLTPEQALRGLLGTPPSRTKDDS